MADYIERDCTVEHQGRKFTSGGAMVSGGRLRAYLGKNDVLTDWHGNRLGTWKATSSWKIPRGWVSDRMYQVYARLDDGRVYQGRSAGEGMIFHGKRLKTKRAPVGDRIFPYPPRNNPGKEQLDISVERMVPSGGLLLSTIWKGQYYRRRYYNYTVKDAKKEFRRFMKNG